MHKDDTACAQGSLDELSTGGEVLRKVLPRHVHHRDGLVLEVAREARVQTSHHLENVRYALYRSIKLGPWV